MEEVIELTLDAPEGVIDCRMELQQDGEVLSYSATVLYPTMVNGFSRSEIYCHTLHFNAAQNRFLFSEDEEIHPKIRKLETQISAAIK